MRNTIVIILVVVVLGGLFAATTYASYSGIGLIASGPPSARIGSIFGPSVVGGGPGSGK
jgi:hypothetical protein